MTWETSDRRRRLPNGWDAIRREVKRRAKGRCQAKTHAPGCDRVGTECDHITPGDDHSIANLQWLSEPCHKAKTARDNAEARARREAMRFRRPEQHPGALRGGG